MRSLVLSLVAFTLPGAMASAQATLVDRLTASSWFPPAQFRGISDLDGDGRRDFLFHNAVRAWVESSSESGVVLRTYEPTPSGPAAILNVAPVADMDGDGAEDIALTLGRGLFRPTIVRVLSGRTGTSLLAFGTPAGELSTATRAESAGDINGDGTTDLIVEFYVAPMTHRFVRIHSGLDGAAIRTYPARWWFQVRAFGDLDGDGHDDLLVAGVNSLRIHSGADDSILRDCAAPPGEFAMGFWAAVGCDHDGDGHGDPVVMSGNYSSGSLRWRIFSSATAQLLHSITPLDPWGNAPSWFEYVFCCGDADGDGVADYATRLPDGFWALCSTSTSQTIGYLGAFPGAVDELGDVNGDGRIDIGSASDLAVHIFTRVRAVLLGQPAPEITCTIAPPPGVGAFGQSIAGSTSLSVGDRLVSSSGCAPTGSRALFVVGTAAVSNPLAQTTLCVGERRALLRAERVDTGSSTCPHYFQHHWSRERLAALGVAPGDTLHTQFVLLDPLAAPNARVLASDAIAFTLAP